MCKFELISPEEMYNKTHSNSRVAMDAEISQNDKIQNPSHMTDIVKANMEIAMKSTIDKTIKKD